MLAEYISLILGVVSGLFFFKKANPVFIKVLYIGYVISLSLLFFPDIFLKNLSFWSFGSLTFIFSVYNFTKKKWIHFMIGFMIFLSFLWGLFDWPYYNDLRFLMLAPVIAFLLMFINWKKNIDQLIIIIVLSGYEMRLIIGLIKNLFLNAS